MRFAPFSKKQLRVLTWWRPGSPDRQKDAILCDGAVRSGKTLCLSLSFVMWATHCFSGHDFALCGKTILSLQRNLLEPLLPILRGMGYRCRFAAGRRVLTVGLGRHENRFYLFGGRDEGSASLIQGVTLAGVLLDEVALMPRSFVEQALARCSVPGSRYWFCCNPEHPFHWFYREWIEKAREKNCLYLHFTMRDNPSLTPARTAGTRDCIPAPSTGGSCWENGAPPAGRSTPCSPRKPMLWSSCRRVLPSGTSAVITAPSTPAPSGCGATAPPMGSGTGQRSITTIPAGREYRKPTRSTTWPFVNWPGIIPYRV